MIMALDFCAKRNFLNQPGMRNNKEWPGANMALNHNKTSVIRAFQSIYLCCV
jgi:hypothetical protein